MEQLRPLRHKSKQRGVRHDTSTRVYLCVRHSSCTDASDGDIVRVVKGTGCNAKVTEVVRNMCLGLLDVANKFCHCLSICLCARQATL